MKKSQELIRLVGEAVHPTVATLKVGDRLEAIHSIGNVNPGEKCLRQVKTTICTT